MDNLQAIPDIVDQQRRFFHSGRTKDIGFRIAQLKKLKQALKEREDRFFQSLERDFKKPPFETYGTELLQLYTEIDHCINKIPKWSKPVRVSGSIFNFPSSNYIYSQPYGVCLVMGTWNYPILLALLPAVSAIAAGNTVLLKPSEISEHTSRLISAMVANTFDPKFFLALEGGVETAQTLLDEKYDHIFFTGSRRVGKIVMKAAASTLTPVTLELGGKSPAIVDKTADLETAAKRITWGKYMNAGQTCVAPDYLYAEAGIKEELIERIGEQISRFYGNDPSQSPDYARIIHQRHFEHLCRFLDDDRIRAGGKTRSSERYIAPTVLDEVKWNDPVMQEEIFGPILPVLTFERYEEIIDEINSRPTPLSLYLFSSDSEVQYLIIHSIEFGGGCINDTVAHLGNQYLPFGGKGGSGLGNYHGKSGFDTFSHQKSIMRKPTWIDVPIRYAPYRDKLKWLKRLFK